MGMDIQISITNKRRIIISRSSHKPRINKYTNNNIKHFNNNNNPLVINNKD